jgi:hypothetical protein
LSEFSNELARTNSFVLDPETNDWLPAYFTGVWSAILDSLNFTFDYWVENNATYLKISLEFGVFSEFEVPGSSPQPAILTFDNHSLSALYTTSVLSIKPYEILKSPTGVSEEANITNSISINIEKKETFKMVFGENYTLTDDSTPYKSTAGIYSINSLPGDVIYHANYFTQSTENIFKEYLGKSSPSLSSNVTVSIRKSSLIYRVCYPTWGNRALSYDPLFIAYIGEPNFVNPSQFPPLETGLIAILAFSIVILVATLYRRIKIRSYKFSNYNNKLQESKPNRLSAT